MKFGFAVPAYGAAVDGGIAELLAAGEELGFDSAWWPDHIAVPDDAAAVNLQTPFLEPLAACAWGLGRTTRLRFGTDVLVAPYRHPLAPTTWSATSGCCRRRGSTTSRCASARSTPRPSIASPLT